MTGFATHKALGSITDNALLTVIDIICDQYLLDYLFGYYVSSSVIINNKFVIGRGRVQ